MNCEDAHIRVLLYDDIIEKRLATQDPGSFSGHYILHNPEVSGLLIHSEHGQYCFPQHCPKEYRTVLLYITTTVVMLSNEPPRGKTNNVVSEQVRHKSGCTVTEAG